MESPGEAFTRMVQRAYERFSQNRQSLERDAVRITSWLYCPVCQGRTEHTHSTQGRNEYRTCVACNNKQMFTTK